MFAVASITGRLESLPLRFRIRLQARHIPLMLTAFSLLPFVLFSISPETLAPYDPLMISVKERLQPPSSAHWFGTDELGRDVYSRVLYGTRVSLISASIIVALAAVVGLSVGTTAGYFGGWIDQILMTITDMVLAFPTIILAMAVATTLGSGIQNAVLAIAAVSWPVYARLVRGLTLQLRQEEFVQAAYVVGCSWLRVIRKHILPNMLSSIVIRISLDVGFAILSLASLGFIGLGATAPTPEWGVMVSVSRIYFLTEWWIGFFPALAITLLVVLSTLAGDELNDLWNPARKS